MEFLRGIARDYCKVKNYTYKRYSGIKNLNRLTPYYDILHEMRHCGMREQLCLPSVYYELAVVDAIGDIKGKWGMLKNKIGEQIAANESLSADDRMYLRTVLKINSVYAAILNRQNYELPNNSKGINIDAERLNNLLCRLTRKYMTVPEAGKDDYFGISPSGYTYKNGTIRITSRVPKQRIILPLRDRRTANRQIKVYVKENYAAIAIPVETKVKKHEDYTNTIYIHIGNQDMFTLSNGNIYGQSLGELVSPETERLARKNRERRRAYMAYWQNREAGNTKKADGIEANNMGKVKYYRQKEREKAKTTTFINAEINRMLELEKPGKIVITRPVVKNRTKYPSKAVNRKLTRSFQGYIRERLAYKCQVNSIELAQINSSGTGSICSVCGAEGKRLPDGFICENCGIKTTIPLNSAKNIQIKYNNG